MITMNLGRLKLPVFLPLALVFLAGCSTWQDPARRDALVTFVVDEVEKWNAEGVDPVQIPEDKINGLLLACSTLQAGSIVIWPDNFDRVDQIDDACAVVTRIAADASDV